MICIDGCEAYKENAGARQSLELISLGRQGTINELLSRAEVFEITCGSIPLPLYDSRMPLTVRKYQRGFPLALRDFRLPLVVSLFPLRAGVLISG
jgi:hypothetical protein